MGLSFRDNSALSFSQPHFPRAGVPPLTEAREGDGFALDTRPILAGQMVGLASWYGGKFEGRRTASGEVFKSRCLTLASRVIPLGSIVEITNLGNGKRVQARVNDRGPYIKGRGFDVSRGVARKLGFQRAGLAKVKVRIVRAQKAKSSSQKSLTWFPTDQATSSDGTSL
jgi:rare lipoprotein A